MGVHQKHTTSRHAPLSPGFNCHNGRKKDRFDDCDASESTLHCHECMKTLQLIKKKYIFLLYSSFQCLKQRVTQVKWRMNAMYAHFVDDVSMISMISDYGKNE